MKQFTPPKVVPDKEVKADEKPPENDQLDDVKIGTANTQGAKDDGIVAPPASHGEGVVEAPKKVEDDMDKTFTKVEIESTYPGGMEAWKRYLNKNFRYPDEAQAMEIQGVVVVQFIVDKEGNVSDVQAVSGPDQSSAASAGSAPFATSSTSVATPKRQPKLRQTLVMPVFFEPSVRMSAPRKMRTSQ